jgi:hypothetical protein
MLPTKNKDRMGLKLRSSILLASRFLTTNLRVGRTPRQLSKGRPFLTGPTHKRVGYFKVKGILLVGPGACPDVF